jgi:hypothetical protein
MTSANAKNIERQSTREERSRRAIEGYSIKFDEASHMRRIASPKGQRLDVDEVLARSLPKTISQQSSTKP